MTMWSARRLRNLLSLVPLLMAAPIWTASTGAAAQSARRLVVTPGCERARGELCSLQEAYEAIEVDPRTGHMVADYEIVVGEGTYAVREPIGDFSRRDQVRLWRKWSPDHDLVIRAADGEHPVFHGDPDGVGGTDPTRFFIHFKLRVNDHVRITLRGLTIRSFLAGALLLDGGSASSSDRCRPVDTWNGGFTIEDNVFLDIGHASLGRGPLQCHPNPRTFGYSVVQMMSSRDNVVRGNVVRNVYNCPRWGAELHFVYSNFRSGPSTIVENFIEDHSGDPFRFRYGETGTRVARNFALRGFNRSPGQEYRITSQEFPEPAVRGITFEDNVFVYPHRASIEDPVCLREGASTCTDGPVFNCRANPHYGCSGCLTPPNCVGRPAPCTDPDSNRRTCDAGATFCADSMTEAMLIDEEPSALTVTAMTAHDLDRDGVAELVVAFRDGARAWVVRSKLRPWYLGDVVWASHDGEHVTAMTTGDFDADGLEELITATEDARSRTRIYRGSGRAWAHGLSDRGLGRDRTAPIYGPTTRYDVTALAAGNFDPATREEELITAFRHESGERTEIFLGNGRVSATTLGRAYVLRGWQVTHLDGGDLDHDGVDEVVTTLHRADEDRVYAGDARSAATQGTLLLTYPQRRVTALAIGDVEGDGRPELFVASFDGVRSRVERGGGGSGGLVDLEGGGPGALRALHRSAGWRVPGLVVDGFGAGASGSRQLVSVFQDPSRLQIWAGDGRTGLLTHFRFFGLDW